LNHRHEDFRFSKFIKAVDVFKDLQFGRAAGVPRVPPDQFGFDGFEECLDGGVVIAINQNATPHSLKHTAVTLSFRSGLTMEQATQYFATSPETLDRV
jgi:hypothetical protein